MGTVVLACRKDIALGRLEQRNRVDDDIAIAEHRLQSHLDETVPVIEDYLSEMDRPVCKVCSAEECCRFANNGQVDSDRDAEQGWVEFQKVLSVSYCLAVERIRSDLITGDLEIMAVATIDWRTMTVKRGCCCFRSGIGWRL